MSQAGRYAPSVVPGTYVSTLTPNSGGAVGPTVGGTINIVGDGVTTTTIGFPGTNTVEITLTGAVADSYETDSGTAIPALGTLIITAASTGLQTLGAGNTVSFSGILNVASGGTGNNAFVDYAPVVGGSPGFPQLESATIGLANVGYVFTSRGNALQPSWQAIPASTISITGDTGGALVSNTFTFTGGTTGLTFNGAGTTETLQFAGATINAGVVTIGTDALDNAIDIGTNANTGRTVTIGNTVGTSQLSLNAGSGGIVIPAFNPGAVVVGAAGLLQSTTGTAGYVLTSTGAGTPTWQATSVTGVVTIDGDTGSATGTTITFNANSNAGSTVMFAASASTVDFKVSDANLNTIIGFQSGNPLLTSAAFNVGLGDNVLTAITNDVNNVAIGAYSLNSQAGGGANIAIGSNSLQFCTTGKFNVSIGQGAGTSYTSSESSNILIGCFGVHGTVGESNVLRIGSGTGTANGQIDATFISGINGITTAPADQLVIIDSGDHLGSIAAGTAGEILTSGGPGVNPFWATLSSTPLPYTAITTAASPYTALTSDYYISVDATGGPVTVNLPAAPVTGKVYVVKDKVGIAPTNNITVATVGGIVTIDGITTFVMNSAYEAICVIFDGTNYEVF